MNTVYILLTIWSASIAVLFAALVHDYAQKGRSDG